MALETQLTFLLGDLLAVSLRLSRVLESIDLKILGSLEKVTLSQVWTNAWRIDGGFLVSQKCLVSRI